MGRKAVIQAGGTILLGFNVAIPMVLDAQGLFPDWPYQYYELLGFVVFAIFVGWVIFSKQSHINKLESDRPQLTIGDQTQITKITNDDNVREGQVALKIAYRNIGQKPAYQLRLRIGFTQHANVKEFTLFSDRTSVNRQDPNSGEIGETYTITVKSSEEDSRQIEQSKLIQILIYCGLNYSDAPKGGHSYNDEWWFSYRFGDTQLGSMNTKMKDELEPYVRLELKKRKD